MSPLMSQKSWTRWKSKMASGLRFREDRKARLRLGQQLDVLTMGPRNRRRLVRQMLGEVKKDAKTNIRKQRTVDGSAMKRRASKGKKRMFRNMPKNMTVKLKNDHSGVLTWKHSGQARTAYRHHHGIDEQYSARRAEKRYGRPNYKGPATKHQARALNKEGFRRRVARTRGKGGAVLKKVSQKWIMDNMTLGQAGLVLRMLRGTTKTQQSWKIKTPARPFLGVRPVDADKFLTALADKQLLKMKRV